MTATRESRLYTKRGRYYADLRDLGAGREAMIPPGANPRRATKDRDVATALLTERIAELETRKRAQEAERLRGERSRVLLGIDREARLGPFAEHHLVEKRRAGRVTAAWLSIAQRHLERAVAFLGVGRPLESIDVRDVRAWTEQLRQRDGRGGGTLSDSTVRQHLNSLSNLYRRAQAEACVPPGFNPVAALLEKPQPARREARWLEVHEAALLIESARTWRPPGDAHAYPHLHALVATFLLTGGRKSEVLGLEVGDVSFDRRTVTFRPNAHRRIKTHAGHRTVPLWPQLEELLREYVFGGDGPRGELLFPSSRTGRMIHDIRKALDAIAERAGWQEGEIRTRIFRHTYTAARLQTLDAGAPVSPWTAARELGHGGRRLVDRVYGHLGEVRQRSEVVEYRIEQHEERLGQRLQELRFRPESQRDESQTRS